MRDDNVLEIVRNGEQLTFQQWADLFLENYSKPPLRTPKTLERLAFLTPRPRVNLILYYGVLAPRAAWRSALVSGTSHGVDMSHVEPSVEGDDPGLSRAGAYQWAELMRRTFGLDVLACPRCGGRLRLVALIEQASVSCNASCDTSGCRRRGSCVRTLVSTPFAD